MNKEDEAPLVQEKDILMHLLAFPCVTESCYCKFYPEARLKQEKFSWH